MFVCVNNPEHRYTKNTANGFCVSSNCNGIGFLVKVTNEDTTSFQHVKLTPIVECVYACVNNSSHIYLTIPEGGFCSMPECRGLGYLIKKTRFVERKRNPKPKLKTKWRFYKPYTPDTTLSGSCETDTNFIDQLFDGEELCKVPSNAIIKNGILIQNLQYEGFPYEDEIYEFQDLPFDNRAYWEVYKQHALHNLNLIYERYMEDEDNLEEDEIEDLLRIFICGQR